MRNFKNLLLAGILSVLPTQAMAEKQLVIYHAGSLSVPFKAMEEEFEKAHPGVDLIRKSGGSTKMARLISEKGESADIMASADYVVIDKNLMPKFADVNIRFASNRLVLCYTDQSKYADSVNDKNWTEILQKKDVVWGHSDPNLDPCGYRSLMVLQLAERFYGEKDLYNKLLANRPAENVKPKAKELVALLKNGEMDYAWEYRSVAEQHGLKYVELDDHINLGNYKMTEFYQKAKVEVTGKKPGQKIDRIGKSITYGVTLIKNSPSSELANTFMAYLLDPNKGMKILAEMGQPTFTPARVADQQMYNSLPASIQQLVEVKN